MKTKIINFISLITLALASLATFATAPAYACTETNPAACSENICNCTCVSDQIKAASGCPSTTEVSNLPTILQRIVSGIILVLGTVAVVVILIGGINYMTSAGDPNKVKKAKDTIMYAAIGLIICILAFAIVNFVIGIIGSQSA